MIVWFGIGNNNISIIVKIVLFICNGNVFSYKVNFIVYYFFSLDFIWGIGVLVFVLFLGRKLGKFFYGVLYLNRRNFWVISSGSIIIRRIFLS